MTFKYGDTTKHKLPLYHYKSKNGNTLRGDKCLKNSLDYRSKRLFWKLKFYNSDSLGKSCLVAFLEGMSENFSDKNVRLKLSLNFSQKEKWKPTSKKHLIYSRKGSTMCLKVLSDNLDTWAVTRRFNLALGKSCHFHAPITSVF